MSSPLGFSKTHKACATISAASFSPGPGGNLPDDLITQILVRLPVRYLVQFELVCKAWLHKIKSPKFIKMHLKIAADRESPMSFLIRTRKFGLRGEVIFRGINWPEKNERDEDRILPCRFSHKYFGPVVLGVANGIVCATNLGDKSIFLWNPATLKSKKLPPPIIDLSNCLLSLGFGFDSEDDYKVVRLVMYKKFAFVKAEVYSANKNCWKEINVGVNFFVKNLKCDICLDGMLYWSSSENMVTYNLDTEEFNNQIELPKVEVIGRTVRKIVEFMDSFALSVHRHGDSECNQEISFWVLDDASGKGSWSKKFSFEMHPEFPLMPRIFLHLKNGSVVSTSGSSDSNQNLVLYDPRTRKLETIIVGTVHSPKVEGLYSYTESLVSIPGSE
ncbi:hypothetical protein POM88_037134 [Heracleum sosnowskyi]|uniref:F-box domain-containing protein n=1 Tax=Heracleum sosnowskyi TaxID=360622 RepID=A0AAD8MFK6_9APIA|nr:hypothetical protein POM88_037134 [Heracleum sosnowskyi]